MRRTAPYIVFIVSFSASIPLFILLYVYYVRPSLIQEGLLTALIAVAAILSTQISSIRNLLPEIGLGKIVHKTYSFRYAIALISFCILVAQMTWLVNKIDEIRARYNYVDYIKQSLDENKKEFQVESLAKAFLTHPERPEYQIIFNRITRSLLFVNNNTYFRNFQSRFVSKINSSEDFPKFESRLGRVFEGKVEYDPLIFYIYVILESNAEFVEDQSDPKKPTISAVHKYDLIKSKSDMSQVHRKIHKLKIDGSIAKYNLIDSDEYNKFNFESYVQYLENEINNLHDSDLSDLISSHHYQEYLDQILYNEVEKAKIAIEDLEDFESQKKSKTIEKNKEVLSEKIELRDYHLDQLALKLTEILRLRVYFGSRADIYWTRQPSKLNAFHFFSRFVRLPVKSETKFYREAIDSELIYEKFSKILNSPSFREFQSERRWYIGSPLTFELNDVDFTKHIYKLLDQGW